MQSMGRNGDTVLAHLSREEAEVLHAITDGGSINPKTGLLEFWNGDHESEAGYDAGAANDAQAAENNAQGNANASARGGDGAGYGDMTPVDAVNRARAALQAQTHARVSRERTAHAAQQAEQTRNARQREDQAKMQDLVDRNNRANSVQRARDTKAKTVTTRPNLLTRPQGNTLEDLHTKKEDVAAKTHNWGTQKQTRPSITEQVKYVKKAREETKKSPAKSPSKPAANPYAGDIAAMVGQMSKMTAKNKPSINEANFGNPEPEFMPAKGLIRARKFAQYGAQIGATVPSNPYMSTAVTTQIGALLGAYIGLITGSFGNRTSTELRDPNTGA